MLRECIFHRLLIAYDNGLIVLWDASEDRIVLVRGYKDLLLKDKPVVNCPKDTRHELSDDESDGRELDKEMSSICWASDSGLVLAVGYIDGDIMFWNLPNAASIQDQKAAKSSITMLLIYNYYQAAEDSIIVLHWPTNRSHNDCGGQLFVYGGDEIGSEEVLTVCF